MEREFKVGGGKIRLVVGDLTKQDDVAVLVNAANPQLAGGGGVDGALHAAAGPAVLQECQAWIAEHGELGAGRVMRTSAGALPNTAIYHTVGPVYRGGYHGEYVALEHCYARSLAMLRAEGLRSIAFPSISTGAYGFPLDRAAYVALSTTIRELTETPDTIDEIRLVAFDEAQGAEYAAIFDEVVRTQTGT